jgi:hypothetical protein
MKKGGMKKRGKAMREIESFGGGYIIVDVEHGRK